MKDDQAGNYVEPIIVFPSHPASLRTKDWAEWGESVQSRSQFAQVFPGIDAFDELTGSPSFDSASIRFLVSEVISLRQQMGKLIAMQKQAEKLDALQNKFASQTVGSNISRDRAKKLVKAYFEKHHGEALYPDDVATAVGIPLGTAIEICQELQDEGKIGKVA